jgi:pseudouridine kinase
MPQKQDMTQTVYCIGSVLWDVIGRTDQALSIGSDVGGRISRIPGGVALNIAMALRRFDVATELLSVVGDDAQGATLLASCRDVGLGTDNVIISPTLPTDQYMAIEDANGVVVAIADAHSLEATGIDVLSPFLDGRLGSEANPFSGTIALDGNLTEDILGFIATSQAFEGADLRIAPASPGKAHRLIPMLTHPSACFYINLEEAQILGAKGATTALDAAKMLAQANCRRVIVTNGMQSAAEVFGTSVGSATPPRVRQVRVTGAGDTLMAAHIAAELGNVAHGQALQMACNAAAHYVSGEE